MGGARTDASGEQTLARVDHASNEDQAGAVTQRRQGGEQALLRRVGDGLRPTDDEHLRASEEQRRAEVVERLLEPLHTVVGP